MIWCGADIAGSTLTLVTATLDGECKLQVIKEACQKIILENSQDQESVRAFYTAIQAFVRNHSITELGLRGRAKGKFPSGGNAFKIEAIVQLASDAPVSIISPLTIGAHFKKSGTPSRHADLAEYQQKAFEVAAYMFDLK